MEILDLGCGNRKAEGAIGVDINPNSSADIIHNLNSFPYPFEDNVFSEVICREILEHVNDLSEVMNEIYRVSRDKAIIEIETPHFSCFTSFVDPTHKRSFSYFTFDSFAQANHSMCFSIVRRRIEMGRIYSKLGLNFLVNLAPRLYERYFAWIFPAARLEFVLQVEKNQER